MNEFYIGLMSGTSADGIDAALVDFSTPQPSLIAHHYEPYSQSLRKHLLALYQAGENEIVRLGELDVILGKALAQVVQRLLQNHGISSTAIKAIGSHGHTIRHHPHPPHRFSIQIGDPNTIAAITGITTIADFRRKDLALQGQGAPLAPVFHQEIFPRDGIPRAIVNIGGIANVTLLLPSSATIAFDTGPGNALMDAWITLHQNKNYDAKGLFAQQGEVSPDLLNLLLTDAYFSLSPPKSTGREYFNLTWLQQAMQPLAYPFSPADIQATLAELTARSIIEAVRPYFAKGEILICGGGIHNSYLMKRLQNLAGDNYMIHSTKKYGIDPDWMEAMAFAWLAKQTLQGQESRLSSITGAQKATILGGIYR